MKRKFYSKTYLKNIRKYKIHFDFSNDEYISCVKEIIDGDDFIALEGHKLISNGYYLVEIMPKDDYYVMRAYLDNNKEVQEYYFDIVSSKGIDEQTNMPFYDDLYLDVVVAKRGLLIYDQEELDKAHEDGIVSDELYDIANSTAKKLMEEIKASKNKYMNIDLKQLINSLCDVN